MNIHMLDNNMQLENVVLNTNDITTNLNTALNTSGMPEKMLNRAEKTGDETIAPQSNDVISAKIDFNINYNAGTVSAGQSLLLELPTNANKKVVFHSASGDSMLYRTRVFYIDNGQINIIEDSKNLLGNFDVDSFISLGGTYYIQIDVLSGSANLHFLVIELAQYSDNEPCDNIFAALSLSPVHEIEVTDFFDNRMDYDIFALNVTEDDFTRFKEVYLNFGYTQENLFDPYKKNVRINCMVLWRNGSNLEIVEDNILPSSIVDHKITLPATGTYYFVLSPYDSLPVGQLVEQYNFSVTYAAKFNKIMLGGNHSVNLALKNGSLGEGTYDNSLSKESPFWINGLAVRLMGSISNWSGSASQLLVRVVDKYADPAITIIADVDANGNFSVVVPLNKCLNRGFTYHTENMEWNYIMLLDYDTYNNAIKNEDVDDSTIIYGFSVNHKLSSWSKYLKVGVCYNDARLNQ